METGVAPPCGFESPSVQQIEGMVMKKTKVAERKKVDVRIDVDRDRLYGGIDDAIKYLQEIKEQYRGTNIGLDEHWTGYEDMDMTLLYSRDETDEEFSRRLEMEERERQYALAQRKREDERKKDFRELERLKSKLGVR
jgi:hypothetical protein